MAFNKEVGKANVKITGDSRGLNKELRKAQSGIVKFKTNAVSAFKATAIGIGVITAAAAAMYTATKRSLEKLDKIGKSAKNIGVSAEAFQELAHAANMSGIGVDLFQKSMAKLEKASEDAKDGLTTMTRAFDKMGISVEDLDNLSPEELLAKVADGIKDIEDPVQQAAIAMQLFGTRGLDMLEMLKAGSSGIAYLRKEARDLGIVLKNDLVANAEKNNDKLETMKSIVSAQWVQVWAELAPAVVSVSQAVAGLAVAFADLISTDLDEEIEELTEDIARASNKLTFMFESGQSKVSTDAQIQRLKEMGEALNKLTAQKKAVNEVEDPKIINVDGGDYSGSSISTDEILSDAEKIIAAQRARTQAIEETTAALDAMFFAGKISAEEYDASMEKVQKTTEKVGETAKEVADDIEEDTNRVSELQKMTNDAVDQIGDALTQAASDGKLDFEAMFKSIIAGAIRAQIQVALIGKASEGGIAGGGGILGGIVKAGMAYYSGGGFAATQTPSALGITAGSQQSNILAAQTAGMNLRAGGGRVYKGQSYTVGELRAERFTPDQNGTINPHPGSGGTAPSNIKVNINNSGEPKNAQVKQSSTGAGMVIDILLEDMEQNGKFSRHLGNTYGVKRQS